MSPGSVSKFLSRLFSSRQRRTNMDQFDSDAVPQPPLPVGAFLAVLKQLAQAGGLQAEFKVRWMKVWKKRTTTPEHEVVECKVEGVVGGKGGIKVLDIRYIIERSQDGTLATNDLVARRKKAKEDAKKEKEDAKKAKKGGVKGEPTTDSEPLPGAMMDTKGASAFSDSASAASCASINASKEFLQKNPRIAYDTISGRIADSSNSDPFEFEKNKGEFTLLAMFYPTGMTLFDLVVLGNHIHSASPFYKLLSRQCYFFAFAVYSTTYLVFPPTSPPLLTHRATPPPPTTDPNLVHLLDIHFKAGAPEPSAEPATAGAEPPAEPAPADITSVPTAIPLITVAATWNGIKIIDLDKLARKYVVSYQAALTEARAQLNKPAESDRKAAEAEKKAAAEASKNAELERQAAEAKRQAAADRDARAEADSKNAELERKAAEAEKQAAADRAELEALRAALRAAQTSAVAASA